MSVHLAHIAGTKLWFANMLREIVIRRLHLKPENPSLPVELPHPGKLVCEVIANGYLSSVYGLKDFVSCCQHRWRLSHEDLFNLVGGILKDCESKGLYRLPNIEPRLRTCLMLADALEREDAAETSVQTITASNAAPQSETDMTHSLDFRSVLRGDQQYTLTEKQALAMRLLWLAYEDGTRDVGKHALLSAAGTTMDRVDLLFRNVWNILVGPGAVEGTYRLIGPGEESLRPSRKRKKTSL